MSDGKFIFIATRVTPETISEPLNTKIEAEQVFAEIDRTLQARGLGFCDLVKTRLFYTLRADYPQMNQVRDPLFRTRFSAGDFPAATGLVTGGRGARPHFEIEVIAHAGKRAFNADGVIKEWSGVRPPFTHGNVAGGILFISGQGAFNDNGTLTTTDPVAQAADTLPVLTKILEGAGSKPEDVLSLTAYLTPPAMAGVGTIRNELVRYLDKSKGGAPPILTVIPVSELAFPGMEVEIEFCARAPQAGSSSSQSRTQVSGPAQATRCGGLLLARSEAQGGGSLASCFDQAVAEMQSALSGVDAAVADIEMLTVWFSPQAARSELEAVAPRAIAAGAGLTLAPMPDCGKPAVIVEAFGNAR